MKIATEKRAKTTLGILLILLTFTLAATGCQSADAIISDIFNQGLESGFEPSRGGCIPSSGYHCAYKSDKREFDINDVTLDFYFGAEGADKSEPPLEHEGIIPILELYFETDTQEQYLIRKSDEYFVSKKYSCTVVYDKNRQNGKVEYNHSETITVPKELFTKNSGKIAFVVFSTDIDNRVPKTKCMTTIAVFYKVNGDKVILSDKSFD